MTAKLPKSKTTTTKNKNPNSKTNPNPKPYDGLDIDSILAIDFGSFGFAAAWCPVGIPSHLRMIKEWTNTGEVVAVELQKNLAALLVSQETKQLVAFGFEAEAKYAEAQESNEADQYMYFEHFKPHLYSSDHLNKNVRITSADGRSELPLVDLITFTFTAVMRHSLQYINSLRDLAGVEHLLTHKIFWVITVPAIWDEMSKEIMKHCAEMAGMQHFLLGLEPIVSTFYVLNTQGTDYKLKRRNQLLVLDCGGGTIDAAAVEITSENNDLSELHHGDGILAGGLKVDQCFLRLMSNLFGAEIVDEIRAKQPAQWIRQKQEFVMAKFTVQQDLEDNDHWNVPLCFPLNAYLDKRKRKHQSKYKKLVKRINKYAVPDFQAMRDDNYVIPRNNAAAIVVEEEAPAPPESKESTEEKNDNDNGHGHGNGNGNATKVVAVAKKKAKKKPKAKKQKIPAEYAMVDAKYFVPGMFKLGRNTLRIRQKGWTYLHNMVLDDICAFLRQLFENRNVAQVDDVILVGGFANSQYLLHRLMQDFPDKKFHRPRCPHLAVVKGALHWVCSSHKLQCTRARYSYGISIDRPFDAQTDDVLRRKFDLSGVIVEKSFGTLVHRNEEYVEGYEREFEYFIPANANEIEIFIYASEDKYCRYILDVRGDLQCTVVKRFILKLDEPSAERRPFTVTLEYRHNGIKLFYEDPNDGQKKAIQVCMDDVKRKKKIGIAQRNNSDENENNNNNNGVEEDEVKTEDISDNT